MITNTKQEASSTSISAVFPFLLVLLYASVEFLNGKSTSDVMGDQWLMISILNIISLLLLGLAPKILGVQDKSLLRHPIILLIGLLLLVSGLSITQSINRIESLVVLTRSINGALMVLVIGYLIRERIVFLRWIAILFSIVLLIQSIQVINQFFEQVNAGESVNAVIYNLKLNAANKNILAAMLVFKCCLTIYCSNSAKTMAGKWLFSLILLPASFAIFLINARASFIAIILVLLINYFFLMITRPKNQSLFSFLAGISGPLLAVAIGFLVSGPVIKNALKAESTDSPFGTVTSRLSSIELTEAGSNSRVALWKAAAEHIQHHPLLGCGIGNWKLASIPYEREKVNDLLVSYHVHNDFLELTAESGIPAGLLYLGIFALAGFYILRQFFSESKKEETMIAILALTALAGYSIDAIFNFPLERPVMQFYFSLIMAMVFSVSIGKTATHSFQHKWKFIFLLLAVTAIPFSYIAFQTSRSLKEQAIVNKDMMSSPPQTRWQDIIDVFPSVPDMNAYTFPIEQVKAIYLISDKKYDKAMIRVKSSEKVNPYLSLTEYLKAKIYFETGKIDSAKYFITKAFEMKPRAASHYSLYNLILYQQKDTQGMKNIFSTYSRYRFEAPVVNDVVVNLINLGSPAVSHLPLLDSALKIFPGDTSLTKTRTAILSDLSNSNTINKTGSDTSNVFYDTYQKGLAYFSNKEFNKAIIEFRKAWNMNNQYLCLENIGLCYYSTNRFKEAIVYFEKVINSGLSTDGKAEFFKGASLISLGKAADACPFLTKSKNKNYPEAASLFFKYCR